MLFQFLLFIYTSQLKECPVANNYEISPNKIKSLYDCDCRSITVRFRAKPSDTADTDYYQEVPDNIFQKSHIGNVVLSSDITSISANAFKDSTIYNELSWASSKLVTISNNAFQNANIKGILLPSSLKQIQASAFQDATVQGNMDLTSTELTTIGNSAFQDAKLQDIKLPSTLSTLSGSAFQGAQVSTLDLSKSNDLTSLSGSKIFSEAIIDKFVSPAKVYNFYEPTLPTDTTDPGYEEDFDNALDNCIFSSCTISSLDLTPATELKVIPNYLFAKIKITKEIKFPSKLETISVGAFMKAQFLFGLTFLNPLKTISDNAFMRSSIPSISFNSDIETISGGAFKDIITLTQVSNLEVETIGAEAFSGCINMKAETIHITTSGTIGGSAFYNCYNLGSTLIIDEASKLDDDGDLIYSTIAGEAFKNSGITAIQLQYYIDSIGGSAFENCSKLTGSGSISTEKIGGSAFKDDTKLKLTSINATSIGGSAFENCHQLDASISLYYYGSISSKAFKNCHKLKTLTILHYDEDNEPTKDRHELIEDQTDIEEEAFYRSGLTSTTSSPLVIPITIKTIGKNAFAHCKSLAALTILGSDDDEMVLHIYEKAFYRSGVSGKLTLPYSTVCVREYAFAYCPITSLEVHGRKLEFDIDKDKNTVAKKNTFIDEFAFYSCKISNLVFADEEIEFDTTTFRGCPLASLDLGNIKIIPEEAFYLMSTITPQVAIPDSVTDIKERAFAGCTGIQRVTFGDSSELSNLEEGAFYGCSSLTTIKVPFEVTKINKNTFYKCKELGSFEIGDLVTEIDNYAFYGCSKISSSLTFPIELTTIGESAFQDCSSLTGSLIFPDSVTKIDKNAFMGCRGFTGDITFGRSIENINENAFRDCDGFTGKLTFPEYLFESVKKLTFGKCAFYNCAGLTGDLILPKVSSLSEGSFQGCSGFNGQLIFPQELTTVPKRAFQDCSGFTGEIPTKYLTTINDHAFHGCSGFNGSLDLSSFTGQSIDINPYAFCNCRGLNGNLILPAPLKEVKEYAFSGCSGLKGTLDCSKFEHIYRYAFSECSGLTGTLEFEDSLKNVDQYAFLGCSGFSDKLTFRVGSDNLDIEQCAFKDCSGFKKGKLLFIIKNNEEAFTSGGVGAGENFAPYYRYDYFLKIGNDAFDGTKFKDVYYLGRFQPDCDYDIGISQIKGIHTSSNYANKTFCNYPLHKSKLSGGAIAGIVIACIVVVAIIVALIVYFVLRAKKNKDNSEGEVEMNGDP